MTTKEFVAIEKRLLPAFPGFAVKGALMFIQPLGDTLRGFHWEPSAFSKAAFYVNVFFLPLYVPTKHLHFTFGHRVGRNKRWIADSAERENALSSEMLKELPFLSSLRTAKDVAKVLTPLAKPNEAAYVNPHSCEALAYTLVRAGATTEAVDMIDRLLKKANLAVDWEREIASRARLIKDNLLANPETAEELLTAWKSETIRNLRLVSERLPPKEIRK